MEKNSLKQLIADAQRDSAKFGALYDMFYSKMFNYLLRKTTNFDLAKDITSDTFLQVLRQIRRFKYIDNARFNAWLYRIATNCFNAYVRKQNKYKPTTPKEFEFYCNREIHQDEGVAIEDSLEKDVQFIKIRKALDHIDSKSQLLIELRFWEELTYEQIHEITGTKVGTLKVQLHRALEKLREYLR